MQAWQATVQDEDGNTVPNPLITVFLENGTTLANIFNENGTAKANPFTGSLEGFAQFWARGGSYRVTGASGAEVTQVWAVAIPDFDKDYDTLAQLQAETEALPVGKVLFVRQLAMSFEVMASGGQYTAAGFTFSEMGPRFTTRARAAAAVTRGRYTAGQTLWVMSRRYEVNAIGPDGLVAIDMDFSGRYAGLMARMKGSEAVTIAAFGDSTTDGNGTSGWTANPTDGSGNAIGSAAHTPPNAWPAVMQQTLRDMYKYSGAFVWNAGYGGKQIVTGWARNNFATAVINNPAYGVPDAVITKFGLNDITNQIFTPALAATEFRYLFSLYDYYGTFPIIATPDPAAQEDRQDGVVSEFISALRAAADLYGIDVIENNQALLDVYSSPGANHRWAYHQPDDLHGGDAWHSVAGGYAAASMFENTLWLGPEETTNVSSWSKQANTYDLSYSLFDNANNAFGASLNVNAGSFTPGQRLLDIYVWCKYPNVRAWWCSVDGDGYYSRPLVNAPELTIYRYLSRTTTTIKSPTAGQSFGVSPRRYSECPQLLGSIHPGLNRVGYIAPTDTNAEAVYLGYYTFRKRNRSQSYAQFIPATGSGMVVYDPDEYKSESIIGGYGIGRTLSMTFDTSLTAGGGAILLSERVFGATDSAVTNDRRGLMLFRGGVNISLYQVAFNSTTVTLVGADLASVPYTFTPNSRFRLLCTMSAAGQQQINLFDGWETTTPLMTVTRNLGTEMLPLGGQPGAFFKNYGSAGGGAMVLNVYDMQTS